MTNGPAFGVSGAKLLTARNPRGITLSAPLLYKGVSLATAFDENIRSKKTKSGGISVDLSIHGFKALRLKHSMTSRYSMKQIESLDQKINALMKKREQIEALRKQLEAQKKTAEKKASRTTDTRTKVLAGAVILNAVALGKMNPDFWHQLLDEGLVKTTDRDLFSLPPKREAYA